MPRQLRRCSAPPAARSPEKLKLAGRRMLPPLPPPVPPLLPFLILALLLLPPPLAAHAAGASSGNISGSGGGASGDGGGGGRRSATWERSAALSYCQRFEGNLFQSVSNDLAAWPNGIGRRAMAESIGRFTTRGKNKGIAIAFRNGVAYVVEAQLEGPVGHHATIYFQYMEVMLEMQQLFGELIPDVEFVIASSDRPMVPRNASEEERLPVFRFCSSPVHADIHVPIFHFYSKRYTQTSLEPIPDINKEYPWETKKEVLFGRFSNYQRYFDPGVEIFKRYGTGGKTICRAEELTESCRVRQHFIAWAPRHPDLLDVKSSPKVSMEKHSKWKYLLHLDGQALSSRLDLLLPLNSLIFKEQSGYTAFYHHLLEPRVHYVPVWEQTPDDVLDAISWAKAHDDEARRIAAAAQRFALRYLDKRARTCYWYKLLTEFAKLLNYTIDPALEVQEYAEWVKARTDRLNRYRMPSPPPAPLPGPPDAPGAAAAAPAAVQHASAARAVSRRAMLAAGADASSPEAQVDFSRDPRERVDPRVAETDKRMRHLGKWRTVEEYLATMPHAFERGKRRTSSHVEKYNLDLDGW